MSGVVGNTFRWMVGKASDYASDFLRDSLGYSKKTNNYSNSGLLTQAEKEATDMGFRVEYVPGNVVRRLTGRGGNQIGYADAKNGVLYINRRLNDKAKVYGIFHEMGHPVTGYGDRTLADHSMVERFADSKMERNPILRKWMDAFTLTSAKYGDKLSEAMARVKGYTTSQIQSAADNVENLLFGNYNTHNYRLAKA